MNNNMPIVIVLGALAGCAEMQPRPAEPAKVTTVRCAYPVITPMPETKEAQTKEGINIALAPGAFQCVKGAVKSQQEIQPTFGETMAKAGTGEDPKFFSYVETTTTPA